jgi:hypothetical protein
VSRIFQLQAIDVRAKPVASIPFRFLAHVSDSSLAVDWPGLGSGNFPRDGKKHLNRIAGPHQPDRGKKNPSIRDIFTAPLERFLGTIRASHSEPQWHLARLAGSNALVLRTHEALLGKIQLEN